MKKFKHLLYYDLSHSIRNPFFEERLPAYCEKLSTLYVEDDYPCVTSGYFSDCDGLVTGVFDSYSETLKANSTLKFIFVLATDTSDFDGCSLSERNVTLYNGDNYCSDTVAEISVGIMILLTRNLRPIIGSFKNLPNVGFEISGKTIGILGAGRIGTSLGKKALALGMQLQYVGKTNQELEAFGAKRVELLEMASAVDVLSVNLPLRDSTKEVVSDEVISKLKDNCTLLCPCRPEIFDTTSLIQASRAKALNIWFDGIDDADVKRQLIESGPNTLVTQLVGARSIDAQQRLMEMAINRIEQFIK